MKSVIVIGGGIAGLGAAWELTKHDVQVTVVEAKSRWGGRIHTLGGSTPIELGAEFVHGRSPVLLKFISEAGLKTKRASDKIQVFQDGRRKKVKFWDKVDSVMERIEPRRHDTTFEEILGMPGVDPCAETWARGYAEGFNAADSRRISAHSILRLTYSSEQMDGDWQGRIKQGYGALIDFLTKHVSAAKGNLHLDTEVRQIVWKPDKVEVSALRNGREVKFNANTAILTLPLGVWKAGTVSLRPSLGNKTEAIQQLEFGKVIKLIFEFRERWWDRAFGMLHAFEEPIPTWWATSDTILTAWAGGPRADKLLLLPKGELISQAIRSLSRMMHENADALRERLTNCYFHNWATDKEIRGAYSYIPVNGMELPKLLAEPLKETLFFAGEATVGDAQTGTTFGALESGLRAAREILGREPKQ